MFPDPSPPLPDEPIDEVAASLDPELLQERREALRAAQEVMDQIDRWLGHFLSKAAGASRPLPEHARQVFWTLIHYQAAELAGLTAPRPGKRPMSIRQWRQFRQRRLPLGRYRGRPVSDAPEPYLRMLANMPEPHGAFLRDLRRYLESNPRARDDATAR